MFHASDDKQYLAMLAIPVLLSIVFAMSGDSVANSSPTDRNGERSALEESVVTVEDKISKRQLLQSSIESHDYDAFLLASAGTPFGEIMTQSAFDVLVKEYQLQKSGYRKSIYMNMGTDDFEV